MSSSGSAHTARDTQWFCCNCGDGPMSFDFTPKCVKGDCGQHSRCKFCKVEFIPPPKKGSSTKSSEDFRVSYTHAAPSRPYEAPAEPQSGLTSTPLIVHSYTAPQPASTTYSSNISAPWPTFDSGTSISPQSLINCNTPSYGNPFPDLTGAFLTPGLPSWPDNSYLNAPLWTSDLDFSIDYEAPVDEQESERPCVDEVDTSTVGHIEALRKDQSPISQVPGTTSSSVKGRDAHITSAHNSKRPRSPSPDMPAKLPRKAPKRSPKGAADHKQGHTFTCPFVWSNPEGYRKCLRLKLSRIRDVKQHLRRCHEQPYFCRRCKTVFKDGPDSPEAKEHDNSTIGCPLQEHARYPEGVTEKQFKDIHGKRQGDLTTQWNNIWDILFPDAVDSKPVSPFLNERLSYETSDLLIFSKIQGPRILQANPDFSAENIQLIMYGMKTVFDKWTPGPIDLIIDNEAGTG
ncbi:hypothetical protein N0V82_005088 [Gnomoniopsis sp. IMI 355080]|nr:hypothetical protein N0V82_005088 [Gnomoniopsis sp. IMI 355080]